MTKPGFPVVISSPSGGGKTTVCALLLKEDLTLERVVTATTRKPRLGEKNGTDYHFWTKARFEKAIKENMMVEWAKVFDNYYGVPRKQFEQTMKRGKCPVLIIDVQGAKTVARQYPQSALVFLIPPDWKTLRARLENRKDNTVNIAGRLKTARREIALMKKYGYIVINDDLKQAVADVKAVVAAEKCRAARQLARFRKSADGYRFI